MQIEKVVKLQKQSKDGTISMTLPKMFADIYGYKPGDKIAVVLDTEQNILFLKKSIIKKVKYEYF